MQVEITKLGEFIGHSGSIYCLEEGLDENLFFSGSGDRFVTQWNSNTFETTAFTAKLPSIIYCLKYLPKLKLLLCGTSQGMIHCINTQEKKEIKALRNHTEAVFSLAFSEVHSLLFSAGGDGKLAIINPNTLETERIINISNAKIRSLKFNNSQSELLIACGNNEIAILNLPEFNLIKKFEANKLATNSAIYFEDNNLVLSGGRDAYLNLIDIANEKIVNAIPAHNFAIYDIVSIPKLNLLVTASRDKTIKLWSGNNLDFLLRINHENNSSHTHSVNCLLWLKNQEILLSAGDDRKIIAWKISTLP